MGYVFVGRGVVGGLLGGVVMAMWSMIAFWLAGTGPLMPLNLIAHTLWRSAPLDATFNLRALVIGAAIHLVMSIVVGAMLGVFAERLSWIGLGRGGLVMVGLGFAWLVWEIMQLVVWRAVDPVAAGRFTPWVFVIAHLTYGGSAALALPATVAGRHAATTRPSIRAKVDETEPTTSGSRGSARASGRRH